MATSKPPRRQSTRKTGIAALPPRLQENARAMKKLMADTSKTKQAGRKR